LLVTGLAKFGRLQHGLEMGRLDSRVFAGLFGFLGGASLGTDLSYQYSKTVMPNTTQDRVQQNVADMAASMSFTTWAGIVGITTIAIGFILQAFIA
jgi:hypothetical protein